MELEPRTTMSQRSFASAGYALKKKRTRRENFLAEMEHIVPWARLIAVIEPLYPTAPSSTKKLERTSAPVSARCAFFPDRRLACTLPPCNLRRSA